MKILILVAILLISISVYAYADTAKNMKVQYAVIDVLSGWEPRLNSVNLRDYKIYMTKSDYNSGSDLHVLVTEGDFLKDRTVFIGYKSPNDSYKFTNVRDYINGWDFADSYMHFVHNSTDVWLAVTCGIDTKICVVRSLDKGKNWNWSNVKRFSKGVTMHEPAVKCNNADDCLLVYNSLGSIPFIKTYAAYWDGLEWSDAEILYNGNGVPHSFLPTGIDKEWIINYISIDNIFSGIKVIGNNLVRFNKNYKTLEFKKTSDIKLYEGIVTHSNLESIGKFRYEGTSIDIISSSKPSAVAWFLVSRRLSNGTHELVLKPLINGTKWDSDIILYPPLKLHLVGASLSFDTVNEIFYLFYMKINTTANTYEICYRTADIDSISWSSEICPVIEIKGKRISNFSNDSKPFGNNLFSGAVYDGNIAIIYQDDCNADNDKCNLKVYRNFR